MTTSSDARPTVRAASLDDADRVADALAAAFLDDPVFGWLLPDDATRRVALRRYFAVEARYVALGHRVSALAADGRDTVGAALVLPPKRWRTPVHLLAAHGAAYTRAFGRHSPRAAAMLTRLESHHLRRPHYYLAYVGVVPSAQNRGVGRAVLTPILDRCDRDRMPAYLEASNPDCARLYRRVGFETVERITPLGAPPLDLMVREPTVRS